MVGVAENQEFQKAEHVTSLHGSVCGTLSRVSVTSLLAIALKAQDEQFI